MVYLHVNRELDFWCSSGIMVFPTHGPCKAGGSGTDSSGEGSCRGVIGDVSDLSYCTKGKM